MPNEINLEILSIGDVLGLNLLNIYKYEKSIIITSVKDGVERIVHLYENNVDDCIMYGINMGDVIKLNKEKLFSGRPSSIEISYYKNATNWDFRSLLIKGGEDNFLRICRNNATFPEPEFVIDS